MDFEKDSSQLQDDLFDLDLPQQPQKKQKKNGLLIGIFAAVAAIALVVGLLFALGVFEKNSASTDELHNAMLSQQRELLHSAAEQLSSNVRSLPLQSAAKSSGAQAELHLLLSEKLLERFETSLAQSGQEMDLDWLKDISISYDMSTTQTQTQYLLSLGLGDQVISSMDAIIDLDTAAMYIGIPELSTYYLVTQLVDPAMADQGFLSGVAQNQQALQDELSKALASVEGLEESTKVYMDLLLATLKDPRVEEKTVTLDGVSQTFSTVTYRLTPEDLQQLYRSILETAKTDEALKQVIVAFGSYANTYAKNSDEDYEEQDFYQSFLDSVEDALTELSQPYPESSDYLEFVGYLDSELKLKGYQLVVNAAEEAPAPYTALDWITVADGDRQLVKLSLSNGEEPFVTVTGEHTNKDGAVSGSYKLAFPEKNSLTLDFTDICQKDGNLTGSIQLTPSVTMMQNLLGDSYASVRLLMGGKMGLRLDFEEGSFGMHLTADGESVIGLTCTASLTDGEPIVLPPEDQLMSSEDVDLWTETLDRDALIQKMKDAGVPQQILDLLTMLPEEAV